MNATMTAGAQWRPLRLALQGQLDAGGAALGKAAANAEQTFDDRLKKIGGPLADTIKLCRDSAKLNVELARVQHRFLVGQLGTVDAAVDDADEQLSKAGAPSDPAQAFSGAPIAMVAPLLADTSTRIVEALCLSWLLCAFLGHKEAHAFVHGAKEELIGALGDPGSGIFTLLRRLHAVATRSLRKDQDAAELLQSLSDFGDLMDKWRQVAGHMGNDMPFAQALVAVTAPQGDA